MSGDNGLGGPAFPQTRKIGARWSKDIAGNEVREDYLEQLPGMSLRDWFAGQALAGLLAHPECQFVGPGFDETTGAVVREAYAVSDAMLKARGGQS